MEQQSIPPKLEYPKLKFKIKSFWTLLGILLGLASLFATELERLDLLFRIRIFVFVIVLSILLPPFTGWGLSVFRVTYLRILNYPDVFSKGEHISEDLERAKKSLLSLVPLMENVDIYTISKVQFSNDKLHILVEKKQSYKLTQNDLLLVIDMETGTSMGVFKVIQERKNDYYAVGYENVSPVWVGYIRQEKRFELEAPPNTFAILTNRGKTNDKTPD